MDYLGLDKSSKQKNLIISDEVFVVRAARLELAHREALDPKSSVSTNSTTPAFQYIVTHLFVTGCKYKNSF